MGAEAQLQPSHTKMSAKLFALVVLCLLAAFATQTDAQYYSGYSPYYSGYANTGYGYGNYYGNSYYGGYGYPSYYGGYGYYGKK